MRLRVFLAVAMVLAAVSCSGGAQHGMLPLQPAQQLAPDSSGKFVKHVVLIVQENRSFDNLFGSFPGVDGATSGYYLKKKNGKYVKTHVTLSKQPLAGGRDINHASAAYNYACDGKDTYPKTHCDMDGFNLEGIGGNQYAGTYPYQYVDPNDIGPYWTIARNYAIADHLFQTQGSGSFTAHQDLFAGGTALDSTHSLIDYPSTWTNWGCADAPSTTTSLITTAGKYLHFQGPWPCVSYPTPTMRDLLDAKGVTWKYYAPTYPDSHDDGALWNAPAVLTAIYNGPEWKTNVSMPETNIFNDITQGVLPALSWVVPDQNDSDHPGGTGAPDNGPQWVASVVNAIGQSPYWKTTAIVIVWDDWGGYFDHVPPPFFDNAGGLGFRVPMLVVSPYVPKGEIVHTQFEFGSILKFVEDTFALGSMGTTDARAKSIVNVFKFGQKRRTFTKIPSSLNVEYFRTKRPSNAPIDSE
jgi:phospholipase C